MVPRHTVQTAKRLSLGNIHGRNTALSDANLWGKIRNKPGHDGETQAYVGRNGFAEIGCGEVSEGTYPFAPAGMK
jgi:hypothetical protein